MSEIIIVVLLILSTLVISTILIVADSNIRSYERIILRLIRQQRGKK